MFLSEDPMVTVVIPCHNHGHWVFDAIISAAKQDYPKDKLRIVVVDDGSTSNPLDKAIEDRVNMFAPNTPVLTLGSWSKFPDGSKALRFTVCDVPVIAVCRPEAGGPSVARNVGIDVGKDGTEVYAFLDADDMYHRSKLRESITKFKLSDQIGVVYSDYDTLRADGLRIREHKEPFSRERLAAECIVNCNSLVLAKAIHDCGKFDEEMRVCEDYDLWMRISEKFVIAHVPESLVTIRVGEHSSSSTVKTEIWQQNWQRVHLKAKARANV
jgi:glycosyltransferase involved in cell wall biosynthesis